VSLLTRVVQQPEDELLRLLAHLRTAEFIYEQPTFPEPEYTFKHALTQEVAYNALLLERRRGLHERTGQAIEVLFPFRLAEHYGALAHHYSRSGNATKAIEYLHLAGQQAVQRLAYAEAISHVTTAVELLETLPDPVERSRWELVLQLTFGRAMAVTKGYAAPEAGRAYARARELCQQVGESPQLFVALVGLYDVYEVQGKPQTAHELAEQLLSLAQRQRDPVLLLRGHRRMGSSLFSLGALVAARAHLEQAIALHDPQRPPAAGVRPSARNLAAVVLWLLGYPEQARERSREGLTLARDLANPVTLAGTLFWAAWLHQCRREEPLTQERAEACMTLATEHGFATRAALGTILRGGALAAQGHGEEGIAQMRQGLAAYRATDSVVGCPYYLSLLAEAYGRVGRAAEARPVLAEALTLVEETEERYWEAELYRLQGELLLKMGDSKQEGGKGGETEECFQKALDVARRQQAKSLELRAAMSLSRLWQRQGKRAAARELLAPVYHWFTEGFDTADLQDAKMLLEALA
jgi:predicted ATPase